MKDDRYIKPDESLVAQHKDEFIKAFMQNSMPLGVILPIAKTKIYAPRFWFCFWLIDIAPYAVHKITAKNRLLHKLFWKEESIRP